MKGGLRRGSIPVATVAGMPPSHLRIEVLNISRIISPRETSMRVLIACAIAISAAVGLAGCFHHQQAVVQQPLPPTPLK
jgi:hypothetical protein